MANAGGTETIAILENPARSAISWSWLLSIRHRAAMADRVRARMARCSTRGPLCGGEVGTKGPEGGIGTMPIPFRQHKDVLSKSPAPAHGLAAHGGAASTKRGGLSLWLAFSLATQRESNSGAAGARKLLPWSVTKGTVPRSLPSQGPQNQGPGFEVNQVTSGRLTTSGTHPPARSAKRIKRRRQIPRLTFAALFSLFRTTPRGNPDAARLAPRPLTRAGKRRHRQRRNILRMT